MAFLWDNLMSNNSRFFLLMTFLAAFGAMVTASIAVEEERKHPHGKLRKTFLGLNLVVAIVIILRTLYKVWQIGVTTVISDAVVDVQAAIS
jgi:hypothetical protein